MDLARISKIIIESRKELEKLVEKEGESLTLEEVKAGVVTDPEDFLLGGRYSDFKTGQRVIFRRFGGRIDYDVELGPDFLEVRGPYDTPIKRFNGKDVSEYYRATVREIEKIQDEEELPF